MQLFILSLLLLLDIRVLIVPSFDLFLHALFPLPGEYLLFIDLFLYHLLVIRDDLINLDHHDLEQVVSDECRCQVPLIPTLYPHLLLCQLKHAVEE